MRRWSYVWAALLLQGCAAPRLPQSPLEASHALGPAVPRSAPDPFVVRGPLREEALLRANEPTDSDIQLPPLPTGVPPVGKACESYLTRSRPAPARACGEAALESLATALEQPSRDRLDAGLAALEPCEELPRGLVTALRAEFAPAGCGDAIVGPLLEQEESSNLPPLDGRVRLALVGLGYAARLARVGTPPPAAPAPLTLEGYRDYLQGPLRAWIQGQAWAIHQLSAEGARLPSYGKALVAAEAAQADLRLVVAVRESPLPEDLAAEPAFREVYESALEQALEPRKVRGRDAGLVALGILAHLGGLDEPRVGRLLTLLVQVYGGRPLDGLEPLVLPDAETVPSSSLQARLARNLPAHYAGVLLPPEAVLHVDVLRAFALRGLPPVHRATLAAASLSPEMHRLVARFRLRSAIKAWRALDVDEAVAHAQAAERMEPGPEGRFLLALGLALRDGPEDASQLLLRAPLATLGLGDTAALDALGREGGPHAGLAVFDAALLKQLAAPPQAGRTYWQEVAARWQEAAQRAPSAAQRAWATERASAARDVAIALR